MTLATTGAVFATAAGVHFARVIISSSSRRSNASSTVRFGWLSGPEPAVKLSGRFRVVRSRRGESEARGGSTSGFSQGDNDDDDLGFLVKLGGGSFVGAGAIKYGSVVFPEITRPNLSLALLMISLPVLLSLLLLFVYRSPPPGEK
ncbi:hypothetical protein LINGRAHAP2_LOCUS12420 [Linum grandiflorum]